MKKYTLVVNEKKEVFRATSSIQALSYTYNRINRTENVKRATYNQTMYITDKYELYEDGKLISEGSRREATNKVPLDATSSFIAPMSIPKRK